MTRGFWLQCCVLELGPNPWLWGAALGRVMCPPGCHGWGYA